MFDTRISIVVWVDVTVNVLIDALVRTVNGVVSDIGILADLDANIWVLVMAVLYLIPLLK